MKLGFFVRELNVYIVLRGSRIVGDNSKDRIHKFNEVSTLYIVLVE